MTPYERRLFERAQRRASALRPDLLRAVLQAFSALRDSLSEAEMARLIDGGLIDRLIDDAFSQDTIDRSTIPLRQQIRRATEQSFQFHTADLPKGGKVDGVVSVAFDVLNPRVIDAIRQQVIQIGPSFGEATREAVRAFVENGLRDGWAPRTIAKEIREIVGLAPSQQQAVWNYRQKLEHAHEGGEIANKLRDRRFDATVAKAKASGERIPAAKVEKMVQAYSDKMRAFHAETIARTAAIQANKTGQALAWQDAVDKGVVPPDRLRKTWVGILDERERPEHVAMEGETVPFDAVYSNGESTPGSSTYNCRCISRFTVAPA